ncbi:MAG: DRTGG domain protein [Deltaproteobacteria bacterium]|nr:DRTGG domain protein [Deltaproteobacteria bacterium]
MKTLYIGSINEFSGKGMIAMVLAMRLKAEGYKVGYMKPLGKCTSSCDGIPEDDDAVLMKEVLGLDDALDELCPVTMTQDIFIKALRGADLKLAEKVDAAFRKVSQGKDVMLVEGTNTLYDGTYLDLAPVKIMKLLDAKALVIDRYENEVCTDCILTAGNVLRDRMIGTVINHVPAKAAAHVNDLLIPFFKSKGIDVMASIPMDPFLGAVSVRALLEALNARLLCCEDTLDNYVERFSIGAMDVDSAMKYFRKTLTKAVITGGHRSDIQIAALETSTRCLILTGDQNPSEVVVGKAMMIGVPILVVREDTLSTVEKVESLVGKTHFSGEKKIERAKDLLAAHFNYDLLYNKLGLSK